MAWAENANVCQSAPEVATSRQPLTREECGKAGMKWSDDANVCGGANEAVSEVTTPSQPLTRAECDKVGMTWKDNANVCSNSEASNVAGAPPGSSTVTNNPLAIVIDIDKARQRMRVLLNGAEKYEWPVSTGRPSYFTPSGSYTATSMNEVWYSKESDDAPMPHSIFFTKDGHAIHGTYQVKKLGKPVSHGCVRISPKNAATLYSLVAKNGIKNTQVVLIGFTPGGEGKVASSARSRPAKAATLARVKSGYTRVTPRSLRPSNNWSGEPPRRRAFSVGGLTDPITIDPWLLPTPTGLLPATGILMPSYALVQPPPMRHTPIEEQPEHHRGYRVGGTKCITLPQATNIIEAVKTAALAQHLVTSKAA